MLDGIDNEITGFVRTAKVDVQHPTILIDNATGNVFLCATHIMITRLVFCSGFATTSVIANIDSRLTIHTQASDAAIL